MRTSRALFSIVVFFAALTPASAQQAHLQQLLDSGLFFRLRTDFARDSAQLGAAGQAYFSAAGAYLFNRPAQSAAATQRWFALPDSDRTVDSMTVNILQWAIESELRSTHYAAADSLCMALLNSPHASLSKAARLDFENYHELLGKLKPVPPQRCAIPGPFRVPYRRDATGLITFPVEAGGHHDHFIFDSGANFSTISASEAERMQLRMLGGNIGVGTATQRVVSSRLAVADSLHIGSATIYNVIFLVLPDRDLRFLGGLYTIDGIIGLPVIAAFGEIHLTPEEIIVPRSTTETSLRNLGLHGHSPFTEMDLYNDSLTYLFDTGAAQSLFNNRFLAHHADRVRSEGSRKKMHLGGAGGISKVRGYMLDNVAYSLGGKSGTLHNMTVLLQPVGSEAWYYGIVGQDILRQYDRVILNFDKMFLLLR